MPRLRHNVVANFVGHAWTGLIGVLFLPVYIRMLGMEAYGLIGVYMTLQALLFVLDLGLSATLNRELAKRAHGPSATGSAHDLVRTLEWTYLPLCVLVALVMVPASATIADQWLRPVDFSPERVARALMLMGVAIATQCPCSLYAGGLGGLERQVSLNFANVVFATLRWVAVIPVLSLAGPSIEVYLYWQIAVSIAQMATLRTLLLAALPRLGGPGRFRPALLGEVRGFALGMFAIATVSFVLIQVDRIVLSRVLPLDQFGRYVLVAAVAATLSRFYSPFFAALYPRYSALVAAGDAATLTTLYHRSNQLLAVLVASVAAVVGFFAEDVLRLWTHDRELSAEGAPVLVLLVVGTALNGLMNLPYALQLAHGWTKLALYQNLAAILVVVPGTWVLAHRFGAIGAASMWAALNIGYVTVSIPLMHRRLLKGQMGAWYGKDVLPPAIAALVSAFFARSMVPPLPDTMEGVAILGAVGIFVLSATAACSPGVRKQLTSSSSGRASVAPWAG